MGKKQYLKKYWQKFSPNWKKWSHRFKNHYEHKLDKLKKTKHNKTAKNKDKDKDNLKVFVKQKYQK